MYVCVCVGVGGWVKRPTRLPHSSCALSGNLHNYGSTRLQLVGTDSGGRASMRQKRVCVPGGGGGGGVFFDRPENM